jgi:hypothetical protein
VCETSGSYGTENGEVFFWGFEPMETRTSMPAFWRNILFPSSGLMMQIVYLFEALATTDSLHEVKPAAKKITNFCEKFV